MSVVLLGDSLTVGVCPFYKKLDPSAQCVAKGGMSIPWMVAQDLPKVDTVLLMGGTNDLMAVSPETALSRMRTAATTIKARGYRVIVGTIPLIKTKLNESLNFNEGLATLASNGVIDVATIGDLVTGDQMSGDGVHPTGTGYQRMAKAWLDAVGRAPLARDDSSSNLLVLGVVGAVLGVALLTK